MTKPRVPYSSIARPTIGQLIERYAAEIRTVPQFCGLLASKIASVTAPGTSQDYISLAKDRRKVVAPATVLHDMAALKGVLSYAKPGWGYDEVTDEPIREAWPILRKYGLVGTSKRRTRIPSAEESRNIIAWFDAGNAHTRVPMPDIVEFQESSTRRISETCRIEWGDVDPQTMTLLVKNMKHPTRKAGNHKRVALPLRAFAILMRQPRRTNEPTERCFPYPAKTIERLYKRAVVALGYEDLHLHDSRRGGTTKLLKEGRTPQEIRLVTGHETDALVMTTYNGMTAVDFHKPRPSA